MQSNKGVSGRQNAKLRTTATSKSSKSKRVKSTNEDVASELTTTSPFIIVNKNKKSKENDVNKVIDGNAVLSNFNVDDLTDDERRDMLTNILSVIQSKNSANEIETSTEALSSSSSKGHMSEDKRGSSKSKEKGTKLLPVTKANNVRIVSSLDELTDKKADNSASAPIYVVLLPQNKKKK